MLTLALGMLTIVQYAKVSKSVAYANFNTPNNPSFGLVMSKSDKFKLVTPERPGQTMCCYLRRAENRFQFGI